MKKLIAVLILLAASAAHARRDDCTVLVGITACGNVNKILWNYDVSSADDVRMRNALAASVGWTATVTCTAAMVALSQCTTPEIGTQVTNPEGKTQASQRAVKEFFERMVKKYDEAAIVQTKADEANTAVNAIVLPVIGGGQ